MERKVALITGITGQDGSYLSEFLLAKGYEVHGTIRRSSVDYRERIAHLEGTPNFHLHYADLGDSMSMLQVVSKVQPTEIYNLAAQSHVQVSFDSPEYTADIDKKQFYTAVVDGLYKVITLTKEKDPGTENDYDTDKLEELIDYYRKKYDLEDPADYEFINRTDEW